MNNNEFCLHENKRSLSLVPSLSTKALGNSEMTYFGISVYNFSAFYEHNLDRPKFAFVVLSTNRVRHIMIEDLGIMLFSLTLKIIAILKIMLVITLD